MTKEFKVYFNRNYEFTSFDDKVTYSAILTTHGLEIELEGHGHHAFELEREQLQQFYAALTEYMNDRYGPPND